ncbi:hypothetical protein D3C84_1027860 [compost metagenome]
MLGGFLQRHAALFQPHLCLLQLSLAQIALQTDAQLLLGRPLQGGDAHAERIGDVRQGHLVHLLIHQQHLQASRLLVVPLAADESDLLKVDHQALPDGEGKRLSH